MADVFISYKAERRSAARYLSRLIESYGYSVWFDYALLPGRDFGAQIEAELRAAKVVVVLWCTQSVKSRWVLEEADLAHGLGTLLPVRIEACEPPLGARRLQYLDLTDWEGSPSATAIKELVSDIGRRVSRPPKANRRQLRRLDANRADSSWLDVEMSSIRFRTDTHPRFRHGREEIARSTAQSAPEMLTALLAGDDLPVDKSMRDNWSLHIKHIHSSRVNSIAFLSGKLLNFSDGHKSYMLDVDANNIEELFEIPEEWADSELLVASLWPYSIYGRDDGRLAVYEAQERDGSIEHGEPVFHQAHRSRPVYGTFGVEGHRFMSAEKSGELIVWHWPTRRRVHRMTTVCGRISGGQFSPDDTMLAVINAEGLVELFDAATGRSLWTFESKVRGERAYVRFSPDSRYVVCRDSADRQDICSVEAAHRPAEAEIFNVIFDIAQAKISKDVVAVLGEGVLIVIPHSGGAPMAEVMDILPPFGRSVSWVAISDEGDTVAALIDRREIWVWRRAETD